MRDKLLAAEKVKAIEWRDGKLGLLDQRVLPREESWLTYDSAAGVAEAIRSMVVRGAPAIGIAAAFGLVLGARARLAAGGDWQAALEEDFKVLAESRPTAVNLFWALDRMRERLQRLKEGENVLAALEAEAVGIFDSDREANLTMAQLGLELIRKHQDSPQKLLTHCNTGALATGGFGTALGVIRAAHLAGLVERVFADETRPWLQGSRLTAWELAGEGVPVRNAGDVNYGRVTLQQATTHSINTAFVDMTQQITNGASEVAKAANDAGAPTSRGWDLNKDRKSVV